MVEHCLLHFHSHALERRCYGYCSRLYRYHRSDLNLLYRYDRDLRLDHLWLNRYDRRYQGNILRYFRLRFYRG